MVDRMKALAGVLAAAVIGIAAAPAGATPTITEFPLPAGSSAADIVGGPDGALWFTDSATNQIGRMTTGGAITEYAVPTASAGLTSIIVGPDGALWFVEGSKDKVGRITVGGAVTEFAGPGGGTIQDIAFGSDGNIWMSDSGNHQIARMTPAGAINGTFAVSTHGGLAFPATMVAANDGRVWFVEENTAILGAIATDGSIQEYTEPSGNHFPGGMAASPDGSGLWTADFNDSTISRVTSGGTFSDYRTATSVNALDIAAGPDGNMWATGSFHPLIEKVTMAGVMAEYPVAGGGAHAPIHITQGPDNAMWFTESSSGLVGRISVDVPTPPGPGPAGPAGAQGPQGAPGPQGSQGPAGKTTSKLVVVAYQSLVRRSSVTVRFAITSAATVALRIKPARGPATQVAVRTVARAGRSSIAWNRKIAGRRAPRGRYLLTLTAVSGAQANSSTVAVRLR